MNIAKKITAVIILISMILAIIMPTVNAVSENVIDTNITKDEEILDNNFNNQNVTEQEDELFIQDTSEKNNMVTNETNINNAIQIDTEEDNIIEDIEINEEENIITKRNLFDDRVSSKNFNLLLQNCIYETLDTSDTIEQSTKLSKRGIWISDNSREYFLNFINQYTIYTYTVDEEGYLIHNNIKKDNANLDDIENTETLIDLEIETILSKDLLIIIKMDNVYFQYDNEEIKEYELTDNDFLKTFSNEDESERIIILNPLYYTNNDYKLSLADYFTKSLQNVQEKVTNGTLKPSTEQGVQSRSATNNPAYSTVNQTVYAGPDSKNYAEVGSIDANEKIYILGQSFGWYHIQYIVTGTGKQKSGMIPKENVRNLTITGVHEENMTGGLRYANHNISVQSCDDFQISTSLGSIYAGEGVTLLYDYGITDSKGNTYRVAYIEFSSPSGTKRGYMYANQLDNASYSTSVARVITTSNIISGPTNAYSTIGAVAYKEFVSIIGKMNNTIYVEYNTITGRKRGYMPFDCVVPYKEGIYYPDFYYPSSNNIKKVNGNYDVYFGPNTNYSAVGSVSYENVFYLTAENGFAYIEYSTSSGAKRGYIQSGYLTDFVLSMDIPAPSAYSNVEKIAIGATGYAQETYYKDGKIIYAYKIGNGPNVLFDIFAQHGFEDNWNQDGIELVKIANNLINQLAIDNDSSILDKWTIYIIPVFNADGLIYGLYKDGPGRHAMTSLDGTGVDMNRCWPADFVVQGPGRYRTGASPILAYEAIEMRDFLLSHKSESNQTILIDSHGWYNQTVGDRSLGTYYWNTLGMPSTRHSDSYGNGYLINWARRELGNSNYVARSVLVEFPNAANASIVLNDNYSGKYIQGTIDLLKNEGV